MISYDDIVNGVDIGVKFNMNVKSVFLFLYLSLKIYGFI